MLTYLYAYVIIEGKLIKGFKIMINKFIKKFINIKLKTKIYEAALVQKDIINAVLELLERGEIVINKSMMNEVKLDKLFAEIKINFTIYYGYIKT